MRTALMVEKLHQKGCKFLLTRNFKDVEKTRIAVRKHHKAVAEGRERKIILVAIQHEVIPDYTILVTTTYPIPSEVEQYGFYPVKKDRANWIPVQYLNRNGKEHYASREKDYSHTTNYQFLSVEQVKEFLKMVEKEEQIQLIYK